MELPFCPIVGEQCSNEVSDYLDRSAQTTAVLSSRRSGAKLFTAQRSGGGATSSFDLLKRGALS